MWRPAAGRPGCRLSGGCQLAGCGCLAWLISPSSICGTAVGLQWLAGWPGLRLAWRKWPAMCLIWLAMQLSASACQWRGPTWPRPCSLAGSLWLTLQLICWLNVCHPRPAGIPWPNLESSWAWPESAWLAGRARRTAAGLRLVCLKLWPEKTAICALYRKLKKQYHAVEMTWPESLAASSLKLIQPQKSGLKEILVAAGYLLKKL